MLTQTLKLFQSDHTAVVICPNPKFTEMLYFQLVEPMKNIHWYEIIPEPEHDIIAEMEDWLKTDADKRSAQDRQANPAWFLVNLSNVAQHYAALTHLEKFTELLVAIDDFAKTHHLKMMVSLPTTGNAEAALLFAQMLAEYLTMQKQPSITTLLMTDKAPLILTVVASDDEEGTTIDYELTADRFTEKPLPAGEQALLDSIRQTVNQMNQLATQITDGGDQYETGRALGALIMEEHDAQHELLETVKITAAIKNEFKRHNETLDALLGKTDSPVANGYNDYLTEHHAAEKWTHHHHDDE